MTLFEKIQSIIQKDDRFNSNNEFLLLDTIHKAIMEMDSHLLNLLYSDEEVRKYFFKDIEGIKVFDKVKFDSFIKNHQSFPKKSEKFKPKAFIRTKKYSKLGIETNIATFDEYENLIIKGNNLYVLSSLLPRYKGKVKLIYIDPPYYFRHSKSTSSFSYNSSFSLSSWLEFLKLRLKLAKEFLKEDGTIWISTNDDGMHYLKILTDKIFGADHFVGTIPRRTRNGKSDVAFNFSQDFDWILLYTNTLDKKPLGRTVKRKYYESPDFPGEPWRLADLTTQQPSSKRKNTYFTMVNPKTGEKYPASKKRTWAVTKDTFNNYYQKGAIVFPGDYDFLNIKKPYFRKFKYEDENKERLSSVLSDFAIKDFLKALLVECKNKDRNKEIENLFDRNDFDFPKPENLIKSILKVATKEGDLVMDFFLGSGTTCAVAHKMERQYIGIEEKDYIESLAARRLQKVIDGDNGGISTKVNWHGGGSFLYFELAKINQTLINDFDKDHLYLKYKDIDDESFKISKSEKEFNKSFYSN